MELVTPNPGTFFWLLLFFGIVVFILRKYAWRPILKGLNEREKSISAALDAAENARRDVALMLAGHDELMAETRREKEQILKEAREIKDKIIAEAREKAILETQKGIVYAKEQIEREKIAALNEIKNQVVELSVQIAEKLLFEKLNNTGGQEKIINESLSNFKLN